MYEDKDLGWLKQEAEDRGLETQSKNAAQLRRNLEIFDQGRAHASTPRGSKLKWALLPILGVLAVCGILGLAIAGGLYVRRLATTEVAALAPIATPTEQPFTPTPLVEEQGGVETGPLPIEEGIPGPPDDGKSCQNKLWTYSQTSDQRMWWFEVQSEVVQMNDFYQYGSQTIIVLERAIAPEERSAYALGLGSAFAIFTDREGCADFDIIANARSHAESRLDQGHSGVIFDNTGDEPVLLANLNNLPQARVDALWAMYVNARQAIETGAAGALSVCKAVRGKDFTTDGTVGTFEFIVNLQPWWGDSNQGPGKNAQVNYILLPGRTVSFFGDKGGAIWEYPGCTFNQVVTDLQWSGLPVYHMEDGIWIQGPPPDPAGQ
ncbi:hypothetical protein IH980_04170 [Patescibacteria group bacterium]|nr:hypothetical protein [Patescibacteria group bacterium]